MIQESNMFLKAKSNNYQWTVLAVLAAFGFFLYLVLRPYLTMLLLALIVALLFDPLYLSLLKMTGGKRSWASLLATITVFFCILIPLGVIIAISANQAVTYALQLNHSIARGDIRFDQIIATGQSVLDRFPGHYKISDVFQQSEVINALRTITGRVGDFFSSSVLSFVQNTAQFLTNVVIFFFVLMYMFQDKDRILAKVTAMSPLYDEHDKVFLERLESTTRSLVKGTFVIALFQGTLGGVMFWALGISAPVFWGVMMMIASLIPMGSGLIWWPATIILALQGHWFKAVVLGVFGHLVISTVDNLIRAKYLEADEGKLPPILTLISVLGGIELFGFLGFIYGPLIAMLFLTSVRIYIEARQTKAGSKHSLLVKVK